MSDQIIETLVHEEESWCIEDAAIRHDKIQRETARYPYMAKLMGLNAIDTSPMDVIDIGGGPVGLSSILATKSTVVLDPLAAAYKKYFSCLNHIKGFGEELPFDDDRFDLAIITNALDHTQDPAQVLREVRRVLKRGGYFAQFHAVNNAITHKHDAHEQNVNPEWLHLQIDEAFETVWELRYPEVRYGWQEYNGKIGQPAFCGLYRKVTDN
jgi:ubiquinone/menaquinone biosynthesis C-methylase UbiE